MTTFGLVKNEHSLGLVDSELILDNLLLDWVDLLLAEIRLYLAKRPYKNSAGITGIHYLAKDAELITLKDGFWTIEEHGEIFWV